MTSPLVIELEVQPNNVTIELDPPAVYVDSDPVPTVIVVASPGPRGLQGLPGTGVPIVAEVPSGEIDGTNVEYSTAYVYRANSSAVYLNGLREMHYIESGPDTITFEDPPTPGDTITIDYLI